MIFASKLNLLTVWPLALSFIFLTSQNIKHDMSLVVRKPVFGVSDQVQHKPGCTTTQDGWRLEISNLERLYYPYSENKGADQLRGYREADLRLCFRISKKPVFLRRGSYDDRNKIMIPCYKHTNQDIGHTYGRVTIRAKNRVVGHPVQQNVLYIKLFGIICSI